MIDTIRLDDNTEEFDVKDLPSAGVTTELKISVWTANKIDRSATSEVLSTNDARSRDAGQFRKNLMSGSRPRKDIQDYAALCRNKHSYLTSPWNDQGTRFLLTALYFDHKEQMGARETVFWQMVDKFIAQYPNLVELAKQNLGKLFDPADYPTAAEVRTKFNWVCNYEPVAPNHWAVEFAEEVKADLSQQYEAHYSKKMATIAREPWDRLHKLLIDTSKKLNDEIGPEKKRYHETLITNAQELCPMLTALNLTKDPKLEEARRSLEKAFATADIEQIKENPVYRENMKGQVENILKSFEW